MARDDRAMVAEVASVGRKRWESHVVHWHVREVDVIYRMVVRTTAQTER